MSEDKFDELIEIALQNATEDRERAVSAFEKTKDVYDINLEGSSSSDEEGSQTNNLQGLMLVGQNVSKLLEISLKANEQIIKLAQLKKDKKQEGTKKEGPFSLEELRKSMM